jgi:hypothetical protein
MRNAACMPFECGVVVSLIDWTRTARVPVAFDRSLCVSAPTSRTAPPHDALQVHGGVSMSSLFNSDKEAVRHESVISSLRSRTGAPLAEVRSLFAREFSRLESGAKVRSYLSILTASNVRTMLRRKGAPLPTA